MASSVTNNGYSTDNTVYLLDSKLEVVDTVTLGLPGGNLGLYIHKMSMVEQSVYAPREGHTPPVPEWKRFPEFRDVLPPGDPAT